MRDSLSIEKLLLNTVSDKLLKEQLVKESMNSLHAYLKTGAMNTQLEKVIGCKKSFNEGYKEGISYGLITKKITERINAILVNQEQCTDSKDNKHNASLLDIIEAELSEVVKKSVETIAYLSSMNMLYSLIDKEEEIKKEQQVFDRKHKQNKHLFKAALFVNEQRETTMKSLKNSLSLTQEEIEQLIRSSKEYFHVRTKKEEEFISISPLGRKFIKNCTKADCTYTREQMEKIVFRNSTAIIDSFDSSYKKHQYVSLKLYELSIDNERVIKKKYADVVNNVLVDRADRYSILDDIIVTTTNSEYYIGHNTAVDAERMGHEKGRY